jgi:glycosyltransferase involved in cell wall biosynthesis
MKILYVITQADSGGAQKYVLELAKAFRGEIATGAEKGGLLTEAADANISVYRLYHLQRSIDPLNDIPALYDLIRLVRQTRPDIVHLNSSKAGVLGSFIKPFTKAKIVYTAHGFVFNEPLSSPVRWFYEFMEQWASKYRDYIIAVSEKDRQSALDHRIIHPHKISVIHNGIPQIKFLNKTSARQYLGLPLEKTIIGTIANFYPAKGIDILIEAASRLDQKKREQLYFAVIGDGYERIKYERLIKKYGLENSFKLLGHRELASHYLLGFDIFTLPSRKEGFPFAILEAMQAGLPIVATDVGGVREALGDAGVIIPAEQPDTLIRTITEMLYTNNPDHGLQALRQFSQKALERSQNFTAERMIEQTEKIYNFLITRPD